MREKNYLHNLHFLLKIQVFHTENYNIEIWKLIHLPMIYAFIPEINPEDQSYV